MNKYIEVDTLIRKYIDTDIKKFSNSDVKIVLENLKQNILKAPTIEPKQGEWIKHDEERDYCSVCKHIFKTRILTKQDKWTTYVDDLGYNYCPNCGARMAKK